MRVVGIDFWNDPLFGSVARCNSAVAHMLLEKKVKRCSLLDALLDVEREQMMLEDRVSRYMAGLSSYYQNVLKDVAGIAEEVSVFVPSSRSRLG